MSATISLLVSTVFLIAASAQNNGFDLTRMDQTTEACTDFFQYTNGTWLKNTEIPATESRWGTFNILGDNNDAILKDILEKASDSKSQIGSDSQLIGDFYTSCMDEAGIEKAGLKPLEPYFKQIEAIKTTSELSTVGCEDA